MVMDLYKESLMRTLNKLYHFDSSSQVDIVATPLGYWGALIGAGSLALRGMAGLPDNIPDIN